MAQHDAFGRETGEDTLVDMGWRPDPTAPADSQPEKAPQPAPPTTEQPGPARRRIPLPRPRLPLRRPRRSTRLIAILALLVVVVASAGSLSRIGWDALDKGENAIRGALPGQTGPATGSLLRAAALRRALGELPKGQLKSLRLTADRIDAQLTTHGKTSSVRVTSGGGAKTVKTRAAVPGKTVRVDPKAPARIVRAAHKRLRDVDHMVLSAATGWHAYFRGGSEYAATAGGRKVHRVR